MRPLPVSTSQLFVLVLLEEQGEATSADLARMMYVTPQSMTTLLGPLRQQGLITQRGDDAHGRRQLLRLTEKAQGVLAQARELTPDIEEELLGGFSAEERQTLYSLLARIVGRAD